MKHFPHALAVMMLFLLGCGWDDDSQFEVRTRAVFFFCPDTSGGGMQVVRLDENGYAPNWNEAFGIANHDLSAFASRQNMVWLSSGNLKVLLEVNPVTGQTERRFNGLPLSPHVFAIGRKQALIADTLQDAIAFVDLKDGSSPFVLQNVHALKCVYNNSKFYLAHGTDSLTIYDESALYPRARLALGADIDDLMFDNIYNLRVASHDSTHRYLAIVTANGDYVSTPNYSVDHSKVRFSPYFYPKFGSEYTLDLQLTGHSLATTRLDPVLDSIDNFEADFFEGKVYGTWQDSLFIFDLGKNLGQSRMAFPFQPMQAFFQYGGED